MKEETYNEQIVIIPPEGYKTCKYRDEKGVLHFEFQKFEEQKKRKLPKSWEEFEKTNPIKAEYVTYNSGEIAYEKQVTKRYLTSFLSDNVTAEAVLALCQLIQLRDCYNGDWKPNLDGSKYIYFIIFDCLKNIISDVYTETPRSFLYFKTKELRDEFLRNFRPLIEKLKPLYGIKEGGEE